MSIESIGKECPKCRAIMNFVAFVDKKTRLEIVPWFMEKGTMSGGLLSGSLRKYRCPNGHEETNE